MTDTKIVVLDDDPTGSQTVHGCLLLTRWDVETLTEGLEDDSSLLFILTNTRAMEAQRAAAVTAEVCRNLRAALTGMQQPPTQMLFVSRSDSTLRGHYPVETDIMEQHLGPFDAHFLVPAFIEGGRITRDGVHYVVQEGREVPAHETEFARDSVFAFHHSHLPDYVAEKTGGRIPAAEVRRFTLKEIRGELLPGLLALESNRCCVVDAEHQADLGAFARQVHAAAARGRRFLFRSAASLLTALAALPPQPVAAVSMRQYARNPGPGAVVVGSHVRKTSEQLDELLKSPGTAGIEVDVERIDEDRDALRSELQGRIQALYDDGRTPVIYTSREERRFADQAARLAFGERLSAFLMDLVRTLPAGIAFLISKGGITSNDVLSDALALRSARVLGQVLAGCSVVRCPDDHPQFPALPVVIFPGNVGDRFALAEVYRRMTPAVAGSADRQRAG